MNGENNGYRAGYIGVVGLPNAGKSTLVNALIGEKVSIVAARAQTTRQRITGILTTDEAQYVFVDTPGLIKSDSGLNKFLQEEAEEVCKDSDALLAVLNIDCDREEKIDQVIEWVAAAGKPWIAVINKVDLASKHRVLMIEGKLAKLGVRPLAVSAKNFGDDWKQEILSALRGHLPASPAPLFDPDLYTTHSIRDISSEIVREKCFHFLKQEIPYGLAVRVTSFKEEKIPKIYAEILLAKDNYKSIVIGQGGEQLKKIGSYARKDIEKFLGKKVFLDLHVSVKKKWMTNPALMKELGYVVDR